MSETSKIETLIATHAEHVKKLSVEELTDGTLDLLVRDALTQAKCLGAIEDTPEVPPVCPRCGGGGDTTGDEPCPDCEGSGTAPVIPGKWTPELVEAFNAVETGNLKPDAEVRGDEPHIKALCNCGHPWAFHGSAEPYPCYNIDSNCPCTGYAPPKPSTAPPADEGEWIKSTDRPPDEMVLVDVRRKQGDGWSQKRRKTSHGQERGYDEDGGAVDYWGGFARCWPEWRYLPADQPKADEGQKWTVVWGMDNRLCCKVCGHPFLGISGGWTHVCQSKADAPVETDAAKFCPICGFAIKPITERMHGTCIAKIATELKQQSETIRGLKAALELGQFNCNNEYDELRAQLAQAKAEKVAAMGEATKAQDELREIHRIVGNAEYAARQLVKQLAEATPMPF